MQVKTWNDYVENGSCVIDFSQSSQGDLLMLDKNGKSVSEVLSEMDISSQRVAVELNEEIVPKARYDETILRDGDTVEVVRFVGGG